MYRDSKAWPWRFFWFNFTWKNILFHLLDDCLLSISEGISSAKGIKIIAPCSELQIITTVYLYLDYGGESRLERNLTTSGNLIKSSVLKAIWYLKLALILLENSGTDALMSGDAFGEA